MKDVTILQIAPERWIAYSPLCDYIGTGQTGHAALGDLVSHEFDLFQLWLTFPNLMYEQDYKEF